MLILKGQDEVAVSKKVEQLPPDPFRVPGFNDQGIRGLRFLAKGAETREEFLQGRDRALQVPIRELKDEIAVSPSCYTSTEERSSFASFES